MTHTASSIEETPRAVFFLDMKSNKCCYLTESEIDDVILGAHPISVSHERHDALPDHNTLIDASKALKSGENRTLENIVYSFVN